MPNEKQDQMSQEDIGRYIEEMPDDVLKRFAFLSTSSLAPAKDADGFTIGGGTTKDTDPQTHRKLQAECWNKFDRTPQINTAVRGQAGRLTGRGFETTSEIYDIQEVIEETQTDFRNRMWTHWHKYVARAFVEGELFLAFTLHRDGFVEIDFIDPSSLTEKGDDNTGIIFHPRKKTMPLFYVIQHDETDLSSVEIIPSIYVAYAPKMAKEKEILEHQDIKGHPEALEKSRSYGFNATGGFRRFIVAWDHGFVTRRSTGHVRTTIEWCNHYEALKRYEIDHKKSAGMYAWWMNFEDIRSFKQWCALTDEERAKTAFAAPIEPGSRIVTPPGSKISLLNNTLPNISGNDTDILDQISSGLNEAQDVMTGRSSGTFASVKASRGPMSDRTSDEVEYFERWLRYEFWKAVFFLRSTVTDFPRKFAVEAAIGWDKNQEPIMDTVMKPPEALIDISFPVSENIDLEGRIRALCGVKHGNLAETLGVPYRTIARQIGMGSGYGKMRLEKAAEDRRYPKLVLAQDEEAAQEKAVAEPSRETLLDRQEEESEEANE